MKRLLIAILVTASVPLITVAASTGAVITIGSTPLLPNSPGQSVQIFVSGGNLVEGVNLNVQLADGGPGVGGLEEAPRITSVDLLSGTIFAGNVFGGVPMDPGSFPQLAIRSLLTDFGSVPASGLLATLTIDTTGFFVGQWSLSLSGTLNGDTNFLDVPAEVINGTITISRAVVPEPGLTGVTLLLSAGVLLRRQRPTPRPPRHTPLPR